MGCCFVNFNSPLIFDVGLSLLWLLCKRPRFKMGGYKVIDKGDRIGASGGLVLTFSTTVFNGMFPPY